MKRADSVFSIIEKEGLTTLEIFYDQRHDKFVLRGVKEWDESTKWDRYMVDFTTDDILTDDYKAVGTATVLANFNELGLRDYLEGIEQLLREGKHHGIEFYYNGKKNIRVMYCKHVNTLGIKNRRHAIRSGGIRRHELDEPEIDVLIDGLNLARAMAYKNAIANIPYGGSKILVQCDPVPLDDAEALGFLAYVIDRTRSFTGPDMGFEPEMADIMRETFTKNIGCGKKGPLGPSGDATAYGVYLAIKEACSFFYGDGNLASRKIAIQGLGAVGYPLAEYLLKDNADLTVTDIQRAKVDNLQRKWDDKVIEYVEPENIYALTADVFSPCAMGGIITKERINSFKFNIIVGAANNQLKAISKEAEIELAKKLADRGILFSIDWAHNTGGVIAGWAEYVFQDNASFDKIKPRIEAVCRDNLRKLFDEAEATGKTPTELAYETVESTVYDINAGAIDEMVI
ncbi:amino acid dehydrogenase [Dehalococcoidia bacterium]|nr:amino acid dehydrogenase [Dehalococcoidia bacterium]